MKFSHKIIISVAVCALLGIVFTLFGVSAAPQDNANYEVPADSVPAPVFGVEKLEKTDYTDLQTISPMDLRTPENVKSTVEYDVSTGNYIMRTKVGDMEITTPFVLSSDEYKKYSLEKEMRNYWRTKNAETQSNFEDKFNITDMKFSLGPADKLFGPGGVQIKTQGSAEIIFGLKSSRIDNPALTERLHRTTNFDFDTKIQLNVNGKVGDKINFTMNYNTEATFDIDQKLLKLSYEGKEDEIIRKIEAGNVSLPLNSSLIKGSSSLFGFKTELQFGKLNIAAVASQQESQSQTVSTKGGAQLTPFEVAIDQYDENRHFFLSHYFRDTYDKNMSKLPYVTSGVTINRVEVWVTNKRGHFDQARNIIGFMDLAEPTRIDNAHWLPKGLSYTDNQANTLYDEIKAIPNIRNIQLINEIMESQYRVYGIVGGEDYEKIESARRLEPSEYTLNSQLGFISLKTPLYADEVLAVAYEYTLGGKVYQVGEFSTDGVDAPNSLIVKLLKGTAVSPHLALWDLMMKNVYYLGGMQLQKDKFKLDVQYKNDSTGVYVNYLTEGKVKNKILLKVMNLDRLDSRNELNPDGKFDYVEGFTVNSSTGRIYFPVVEPFGEHLRKAIGNDAIADKYVFQELYDSTLVVARELSEKNKFRLAGEYQASSGSEIRLNAMNVPRGSVKVTAGGRQLVENVDYTVDYTMGTVTILNQSVLAAGTPIDVSLENQSTFNLQRKTLLGTHLEYQFNKNFSVGGTIMHLSEMPLVTKTEMGSEPISNTIWGLNASYRGESQWLTNVIDKIPGINATAPSTIVFNGEFAHLIPGHRKIKHNSGYAYLDDFESTKTGIDLRYPYYWHLASTPYDPAPDALFPEAAKSNDVDYGKNRALMSWYSIDNSVFNRNNSTTPEHIRRDKDLQSNHLTREVLEQEIFPNREGIAGQSSYLSVLNLSYYPLERGPYNLDVDGMNPDGTLSNPEKRWGGMMRKIETSDFETSNIEYIEFWMMDPFVNDKDGVAKGGDLYFNLGDISEDILKDGKKFFENGMSITGDTLESERTIWGRVPRSQSMVLAFDNDAKARIYQDVGFDGLRTEEEHTFSTYKNYVEGLRGVLSPAAIAAMELDPYSPLNDPAGDNFHHYRGSDYDEKEVSILKRYKRYCGVEGNSQATGSEVYTTSSTTVPDVEDINQDNMLNENEKYFKYKGSLRRSDLEIGKNYITDKIVANVELANGTKENVTWYQFKIPIREYTKKIGSIRDFKSIRFMRMFLHDFKEETHLRFGTLELVRGEWRTYTKDLFDIKTPPTSVGQIDVSAVNIEENINKEPVNYVLPPGVTRETDPSQPQLRQENEQSMLIKIKNLSPDDARAVYKNINYDMRQYRRIQMFTHAEKLVDDATDLKDYEMTLFLRMGSDNQSNYYEYEIPLKLTPAGHYSSNDADVVWPKENMIDFPLAILTKIKQNRNQTKRGLTIPYSEYDPEKPKNKITVVGNPNLGEIRTMMIGVRNRSNAIKATEVWVNELRLTDYNEDGGWGAMGNLAIGLSDVGTVNMSGRYESAGFGSIEQNIAQRRLDDYTQFNVSTAFEFGRFFPAKANVRIPLYYSYSIDNHRPKYNPLDQDIELNDALEFLETKQERDSLLKMSQTQTINHSVNLTNVRVDIRSKKPKIYDPANFSVSYAYNQMHELNPETDRNVNKEHKGAFNYNYSTSPTPWEPFKNSSKLKNWRIIKEFGLNYMPNLLAYSINLNRRYSETQLRDLNGSMEMSVLDPTNPLLSFSKDFVWDRQFEIKYDLTKNLKFSLRTATNSRFDEALSLPVNQKFFPDEYELWKDTVLMSMSKGGRPLNYQQLFTASWAIPINKIPYLDFITANAQYNANYKWDTGVLTADINVGNVISNVTNWQLDGQLNFETLYNKSKYLKQVNQKFSSTPARVAKFTPNSYSQVVAVQKGEKQSLKHTLNSDKVKVQAMTLQGKAVKITYKVIDKTTVEWSSKTTQDSIKLFVETTNPNIVSPAQQVADFSVRFLMLVRRVSIMYKETNSMVLPGFMNDVTFFGQSNIDKMLVPGFDFAFGMPDKKYLQKAMERNWITSNDSIIDPAMLNHSKDLDIKATIEPIAGLKIDLTAKYVSTDQNSIQYMFEGMPNSFTGTLRVTKVAFGTAFWRTGKLDNNYNSRAFNQFKENRQYVMEQLQGKYTGSRYPSYGFMKDNPLSGQTYDPINGAYTLNSPDVLIPSFLAAYTNKPIEKAGTSLFPAMWSLLPNWRLSYTGLSRIPWINKNFTSLTLSHAYQCTYNIGSYTSFMNYAETEDGLGFVRDVTSGNPVPSSPYDIASVALNESFSPLFSIDAAMKNSLTAKLEYRQQRNLTLNLTSMQLLESYNKEWVVGIGYVIKDFDVILKLKQNKQKKVKNDLTTRLDFSFKDIATIIRKLDSETVQPTSGNKTLTLKLTVDYVFSSKLNLRLFCDYQMNNPLISTSYPMSNTNFGLSVKFMLTR